MKTKTENQKKFARFIKALFYTELVFLGFNLFQVSDFMRQQHYVLVVAVLVYWLKERRLAKLKAKYPDEDI